MSAEYCEMCDLPLATCVHGMPPAPKEPPRTAKVTTRRTPVAKKTATPTRTVVRKWTSPDMLAPHIVAVLEDAEGVLEQDDLFAALEERVELKDGDREKTPEGEPRWQYAARRARQQLVAEGVMVRAQKGMWELA